MTHAEMQERVSAYVDGELSPEQSTEVAEHLARCSECANEYAAMLATVHTLREKLARFRAPDVLRARVRSSLRAEPASRSARAVSPPRIPWRAVAAAVVLVVATSGVTLLAGRRNSAPPVAEAVLTSHVRSLMPEHLVDVHSSDQHNVKPWFNGRLDFSPSVPRLEDDGFPLLGGRLDYLNGRSVAVVVYGRRQHVINVFSWPTDAQGDVEIAYEFHRGYNMFHWRRVSVEYWVASDLNAQELREFAGLFQRTR